MSRRVLKLMAIVAIATALPILTAMPADAHPLGNFTINRFSGIEVFPDRVVVHYVVDMAEIPSFQELRRIDFDGDDIVTNGEIRRYASDLANDLIGEVTLTADGKPLELATKEAMAGLSSGQGGLDVLRVDVVFSGHLDDPEATLHFVDRNYADRLGWKEIVAYGTGGQGIVDSSVPSESASNELRSYPRDLLSSPVDVSEATIKVAPGAAPAPSSPQTEAPQVGPGELFAGAFASLLEGDMSPAFIPFAVLLAVASGALHALGPGHGKTVMAAYLVGTEGRLRHAVAVGVAISLMHTTSVVVLGLITLWASRLFPPETVYPYLSLVSGTIIVGLGAWLLGSRVRARRQHIHAGHHSHGHDHPHGPPGHTHGPAPGPSPLSWKGLLALALSGGILPSPTALVVLLGAVALQRVALGVTLVAAFSIGLAGALILIGVLVLSARRYAAERFGSRSTTLIPIGSAGLILTMGLLLTTRAVLGF
jgi:nickel/cobalt transporter (NicO) family protein